MINLVGLVPIDRPTFTKPDQSETFLTTLTFEPCHSRVISRKTSSSPSTSTEKANRIIRNNDIMPPKRITVEKESAPRARASARRGVFGATYDALMAPDRVAVVRSVVVFGVRFFPPRLFLPVGCGGNCC